MTISKTVSAALNGYKNYNHPALWKRQKIGGTEKMGTGICKFKWHFEKKDFFIFGLLGFSSVIMVIIYILGLENTILYKIDIFTHLLFGAGTMFVLSKFFSKRKIHYFYYGFLIFIFWELIEITATITAISESSIIYRFGYESPLNRFQDVIVDFSGFTAYFAQKHYSKMLKSKTKI